MAQNRRVEQSNGRAQNRLVVWSKGIVVLGKVGQSCVKAKQREVAQCKGLATCGLDSQRHGRVDLGMATNGKGKVGLGKVVLRQS